MLVRELRETTDLGALVGAGLLVAATVTGVRVLWTLVPNPGLGESLTQEEAMRTHPGLWAAWGGIDGFFAARFIKA